MRVAITDFYAVSDFQTPRVWSPRSGFEGEVSDSFIAPDPKIGEILTRDLKGASPERIAVSFGCSKPIFARGEHDYDFAAALAAFARAEGECFSPTSACATGAHALALGARLIEQNRADVVVAGAVEHAQHPMVLAAYKNMGALSKGGKMRPFDQARDGFLPARGAGFLLLEREDFARARGAKIWGFLSGYSMKGDATHLTSMSPNGDSIARAIEDAMRRAGFPTLDYINAHGTATRQNDAIEARGIELVLGREILVSSTKSLTGHLLGAAGAVETILCLLAMENRVLPPTLGLENVDETLRLNFIRGGAKPAEIRACLSLNYGFGGHIGALILEKN